MTQTTIWPPPEQVRECACGCGASLTGMRSDAVFHGAACRARAHRQRRQPQRPHVAWAHCRCGRHLQVMASSAWGMTLPLCCPVCGADPPLGAVRLAEAAAGRQNRSYTVQKAPIYR